MYYDAKSLRKHCWQTAAFPYFLIEGDFYALVWMDSLLFSGDRSPISLAGSPVAAQTQRKSFSGTLCAHRGLHDGNQQVYENSMKAFALAADSGYGIEMDVQLTLDDQLVIHHDASTARVCGTDCVITQTAYADLPAIPDGSQVPLFSDFLTLIAGRVPLIVEIKAHGDPIRNAQATLRFLRAYKGPYCIESFDTQIVRYFRKHAPEIIRGQLASGNPAAVKTKGFSPYFAHKHLLFNFRCRPHFIAYDCNHQASPALLLAKHVFGTFLVAWTVRDQQTLDKARKRFDTWILKSSHPCRLPIPKTHEPRRQQAFSEIHPAHIYQKQIRITRMRKFLEFSAVQRW